jgi:hypothetical protein
MLAFTRRLLHVSARRKAIALGVAVGTVIALGGGWAVASFSAARQTSTAAVLTSAAIGSVASAGSHGTASATVRGSQTGTGHLPDGSTSTKSQTPSGAGLLPVPAGALLSANARAGASTVDHSATGGGTTTFFHLGFTAQSHRNGNVGGTVSGNAQFSFISSTVGQLHVSVDCLEIVGNDAYMSGKLTKAGAGLAAGTEILFGVQDDDTASKPDLMSDIFFSPATPPVTCHAFHATPHYAVQGNIEIH